MTWTRCSLYIAALVLPAASCNAIDLPRVVARGSDDPCRLSSINGTATAELPMWMPPGNNGTGDLPIWGSPSTSALRRLRPRAGVLDHEAWLRAIDKGKGLWDQLQRTLHDTDAKDNVACKLETRWDFVCNQNPAALEGLDRPWRGVLPTSAVPDPEPRRTFYSAFATAPKGTGTLDFSFLNRYSTEYGIIDVSSAKGMTIVPGRGIVRAPDHWSDVSWQIWRILCEITGKNAADLAWILQTDVVNTQTRMMISYIFKTVYGISNTDLADHKEKLRPGDDAFYALLSSPNVIGTIYLLMHNVNALRRKTIREIGLVSQAAGTVYHLWVALEPTAGIMLEHGGGETISVSSN